MSERTPAAPSLTEQTVSGLRWAYLDSLSSVIGQAIYVAVMSRLLDPVAFGLMAIANMALAFGIFVAQMGVSHALIQRPQLTEDDVRAGATSGMVLGVLSGIAFALLAPFVAGLVGEPDAIPLLRLMGFNFLLSGLQMTSQGLLRRQLRFRSLAVAGIAATTIGFTTGIVLALLGVGVYSLPLAVLTQSAVRTLMYDLAAKHSWKPLLRWEPYRELFGFGSRSTLLRLMEVLGTNLDTLAVARWTSTFTVGLYSRAYYLVMLPLGQYLTGSLMKVLFPGFSRIQQDTRRVREVFGNTLLLMGVVLFPLCAGVAAAGPELILVVLGGQWTDATVFVPWFALSAGLGFMSRLVVMLCESRARLNIAMGVEVASVSLMWALLVAASNGPAWWFAAAFAAEELVRFVAYLFVTHRVADMSYGDLRRAYLPGLVAAAWVGGLIFAVRSGLLTLGVIPVVVLLAEVLVGALALVLFVRFSPFASVRRQLRTRIVGGGVASPAAGGGRWRTVEALLGPEAAAVTPPGAAAEVVGPLPATEHESGPAPESESEPDAATAARRRPEHR